MAIDKKKKEAVKTVVKITDAEEKKKALDTAIAYIEKQFGKGAVSYTHLTLPTIA